MFKHMINQAHKHWEHACADRSYQTEKAQLKA